MPEEPNHEEHHGEDASEKPPGGAKSADNPEPGDGTGEGEGGLGTQIDAAGGGEPSEPDESGNRPSQKHPHGQSGR